MAWIGFSMMLMLGRPAAELPETPPETKPAGVSFIGLGIVMHGVAAGGNVWRASLAMRACPRGDDPIDVEATLCRASNWRLAVVSVGTMGLNLGGIAMIATGSGIRSRYDVERFTHSRQPALGLFVAGGVLAAVGAATSIGLRATMLATHRRYCDGGAAFAVTYGCRRGPTIGYFAGLQASALVSSIGTGMLAYAWGYERPSTWSLAPAFGAQSMGLQASGRF